MGEEKNTHFDYYGACSLFWDAGMMAYNIPEPMTLGRCKMNEIIGAVSRYVLLKSLIRTQECQMKNLRIDYSNFPRIDLQKRVARMDRFWKDSKTQEYFSKPVAEWGIRDWGIAIENATVAMKVPADVIKEIKVDTVVEKKLDGLDDIAKYIKETNKKLNEIQMQIGTVDNTHNLAFAAILEHLDKVTRKIEELQQNIGKIKQGSIQ